MKFLLKNTRAESLVEAIAAIAMLIVVIAPASTLFVSSSNTTYGNRSDLVAAALAEEGIEIMRNFRDTNLLRFSSKAEECWNTKPEHAVLDTCGNAPNLIAADEKYKLNLNRNDFSWTLAAATADALNANLGGMNDGFFRLYLDPTTKLYSHDTSGATASPFYRDLNISYVDIDTPADGINDAMKVIVRVLYIRGGGVRTVKRAVILTPNPS